MLLRSWFLNGLTSSSISYKLQSSYGLLKSTRTWTYKPYFLDKTAMLRLTHHNPGVLKVVYNRVGVGRCCYHTTSTPKGGEKGLKYLYPFKTIGDE